MATSVLIVDDNPRFRQQLKRILQRTPDVEVVGEAADGAEAVRLAREQHPAVILMDIAMPGISGLEAMEQIKTASPAIKVLVLTAHTEEAYRMVARQQGADAFLKKQDLVASLLPTLRAVVER